MKKIIYYIFAGILTLGVVSCSKEEIETPKESSKMTITAILGDDEDTKTIMDGDDLTGYKTLWGEGDQIKIYNPKDSQTYTYTLTAGEGSTIGIFTGDVLPYGDYIATYGSGFSYGASSGFLASEQQFISDNDASYIPMTAKVHVYTDGEETVARITNFRNATGLLRLNLNGTGPIKKIKISTDKYISGIFTLDNTDGSVKITQSVVGAFKYITINCGDSGIDLGPEDKSFYFSVPKGEYNEFKIEITDLYNCVITKTLKADKKLNIERSKINPVRLTINFPTGKAKANINGEEIDVIWFQLWENGPKFAKYNVGVTDNKVNSFGGHYCWGGTIDRGYDANEGSKVLSGDTDTATILWGSNWRMPTRKELEELIENCNITWTSMEGVDGTVFSGKLGKYAYYNIFLPLAGRTRDGELVLDDGSMYWTSEPGFYPAPGFTAYCLWLQPVRKGYINEVTEGGNRVWGYSIRAVLAE